MMYIRWFSVFDLFIIRCFAITGYATTISSFHFIVPLVEIASHAFPFFRSLSLRYIFRFHVPSVSSNHSYPIRDRKYK